MYTRFPLQAQMRLLSFWFLKAIGVRVGLVEGILQSCLLLLLLLKRAVGHSVGHHAELAEQDLPEEKVDPGVQDLIEGGQADGSEEEVTV